MAVLSSIALLKQVSLNVASLSSLSWAVHTSVSDFIMVGVGGGDGVSVGGVSCRGSGMGIVVIGGTSNSFHLLLEKAGCVSNWTGALGDSRLGMHRVVPLGSICFLFCALVFLGACCTAVEGRQGAACVMP